ncbi:hypothetical protein [Sphingobium sp. RAC03]|uniref:hypothetical protein n=1 Tax=Sphingobium sp. RAC03 TaxID=1843368 RepID=UPI00083D7DC1|nr:hypothetical protein [Sphingobium sp. RAC03]AOF96898.1 hypothetical protein BSY17_2674 [Sphingobium sp. RAC03]
MSAAVYFAGKALITLAGLCSFGLILHQFQAYADKALEALWMGKPMSERPGQGTGEGGDARS